MSSGKFANLTHKDKINLKRAGLSPYKPYLDEDEARQQATSVLEEMTDEEKFAITTGTGFDIRGIKRLGLKPVHMADASSGIHIRDHNDPVWGDPHHKEIRYATLYPSQVMTAATFNRTLSARVGRALSDECRNNQIDILLAPGLNIQRSSQCGRHFEYYSEDPYLTSEMGMAFVTALQNNGTAATIKHFIANQTDYFRKRSNSVVPGQALEEIYKPAFIKCIRAGALCLMTAYNQLNGTHCGQSYDLLTKTLREEIGYQNLIMTDWLSVTDGHLVAQSGQNLEMPFGDLLKSIKEELIGSKAIETMAYYILKTMFKAGIYLSESVEKNAPGKKPCHKETAYLTAVEGYVLLKNSGMLPVGFHDGEKVLVTGNMAAQTPLSGNGSAYTEGFDHLSYFEALQHFFPDVTFIYRDFPSAGDIQNASRIFVFSGYPPQGAGNYEGESRDRPFSLPEKENQIIQNAVTCHKQTAVVIVSGGAVEMPWEQDANAIIYGFFAGQEGPRALCDLLAGRENFSGKLPFTIEKHFKDSPAYDDLPDGASLNEAVQDGEPTDEKPSHIKGPWPYPVSYNEGIFVGYRWYEKNKIQPGFPFGHGLSYSSFTYLSMEVLPVKKTVRTDENLLYEIRIRVKNNGPFGGKEIVQLYTGFENPDSDRPVKELKDFEKMFFEAGEEKTVTLYLDEADFIHYRPKQKPQNKGASLAGPVIKLYAGTSSTDIRLKKTLSIPIGR